MYRYYNFERFVELFFVAVKVKEKVKIAFFLQIMNDDMNRSGCYMWVADLLE